MPDAATDAVLPSRGKVVAIWTRRLDGEPMAGRLRIAHAIRAALTQTFDVVSYEIPSVAGAPTVRRLLEAGWAFAVSILSLKPLPLQCVLFAASSDLDRLVAAIPPDAIAVYLDGIRCYSLLQMLRRARPQLRIVADLDDLMSRRMSLLLTAGEPLSPGYLTSQLPKLLRSVVANAWLGRLLVRYEGAALKRVEQSTLDLVDVATLLSEVDTTALKALAGPDCRAQVVAIPAPAYVQPHSQFSGAPIRFVFLGTDALTQNRLTIDYLCELWTREQLQSQLFIYGMQLRGVPPPANVTFEGYVESLSDVYDGRSVLVTPSFLGGGVKTKVLEAFAFGSPVIGNERTFESIVVSDYPLRIEGEDALLSLLRSPDQYIALFQQAAAIGAAYVQRSHDPVRFAKAWRNVLVGAGSPSDEGA